MVADEVMDAVRQAGAMKVLTKVPSERKSTARHICR
jgi:hypothetical protein